MMELKGGAGGSNYESSDNSTLKRILHCSLESLMRGRTRRSTTRRMRTCVMEVRGTPLIEAPAMARTTVAIISGLVVWIMELGLTYGVQKLGAHLIWIHRQSPIFSSITKTSFQPISCKYCYTCKYVYCVLDLLCVNKLRFDNISWPDCNALRHLRHGCQIKIQFFLTHKVDTEDTRCSCKYMLNYLPYLKLQLCGSFRILGVQFVYRKDTEPFISCFHVLTYKDINEILHEMLRIIKMY